MRSEDFSGIVLLVFLGLVVLAALIISAPYVVAYIFPVIALGVSFGYLWVRASRGKKQGSRHYDRLIGLIPLCAIALQLVLFIGAPKNADTGSRNHKKPVIIELRDPWKEGFNAFYLKWYGWLFGVREGETSFDFEQFSKLLWIGLGSAPLFGLWFSRMDLEKLQVEKNMIASAEDRRLQEKKQAHRKEVYELNKLLEEARKTLQAQQDRIEALEQREKYLSRPGALKSEFQRPDLSGL